MDAQSVPCKIIATGILNSLPIIDGKYDQCPAKEITILETLFIEANSLMINKI